MRPLLLGVICGASVLLNAWLLQQRPVRGAAVREARAALQAAETARGEAEARAREVRAAESASVARERGELIRLRGEAAGRRTGTNELAALQQEVERLRARVAARAAQGAPADPAADESRAAALAVARERARSILCINHLKQVGLAARVWATDRASGRLPASWEEMQAELGSPRILFCPSQTDVETPADWSAFDPATATYRMLNAGASDGDPETPYVECPVHGHRVLADGSVRQGQRGGR